MALAALLVLMVASTAVAQDKGKESKQRGVITLAEVTITGRIRKQDRRGRCEPHPAQAHARRAAAAVPRSHRASGLGDPF